MKPPLRVVGGLTSAGKSGYIFARYGVLPTPLSQLEKSGVVQGAPVAHFGLNRRITNENDAKGDLFGRESGLDFLSATGRPVIFDLVYAGREETLARLSRRRHREANLSGYRGDAFRAGLLAIDYAAYMLRWRDLIAARGWELAYIHAYHGRYYATGEQTFERIVTHGEDVRDRLNVVLRRRKLAAVRGWAPDR